MAIMMGGYVRVGLEDNMYVRRGVLATNAQLVEKVIRLANEFEREVASPDEAHAMLGLKGCEAVNY
jgi:3-keto-5-aminohexanoate cleavage enzyme